MDMDMRILEEYIQLYQNKDEDDIFNEYAKKSSIIVGYMLDAKILTPVMLQRLR